MMMFIYGVYYYICRLSNGVRAKGVKRGGGVMTVSKRQFSEPVRSVEMNGCGVGTEMLNKEVCMLKCNTEMCKLYGDIIGHMM